MVDVSKGVTLMIAGMTVLFAFMAIMIVILHFFQKIATRFEKKD